MPTDRQTQSVSIKVTPSDEEWLRKAAEIISGKAEASELVRRAAARELYRLAYRAQRERER